MKFIKKWLGILGSEDGRYAQVLKDGMNSRVHREVRWSRRLMKISDKLKLTLDEQAEIYEIGSAYYEERKELRALYPHLPDILEQDLKTIRVQRDLKWKKVLDKRFDSFMHYYYKYGKL